MNQTAGMFVGMMASGLTAHGLNGIDAKFNISGNAGVSGTVLESGSGSKAEFFRALARDDARKEVSNLLDNGEIRIDDLQKLVPKEVPNTFVPTDTIKIGDKYEFTLNDGQKVIIRWHEPDPVAAGKYPGCVSGSRYTAEIKVGNKQLKVDGGWSRNQSTNDVHVPIKGK